MGLRNLPGDFTPDNQYGFTEHPVSDDWDFEAREASYDHQADQGLRYKSEVTLNLRKPT